MLSCRPQIMMTFPGANDRPVSSCNRHGIRDVSSWQPVHLPVTLALGEMVEGVSLCLAMLRCALHQVL